MAKSRPRPQSLPPRAWQRMLSGRRLNLLDPSPFDIELEDIAHGLARMARWNGQTHGDNAYSVASHCLLVEALLVRYIQPRASPKLRLAALFHDAAEYVIGDLISPFKHAIGGDYKKIELALARAIHMRFGLPAELPEEWEIVIKQADRAAAYYEATHLVGFTPEEAQEIWGKLPWLAKQEKGEQVLNAWLLAELIPLPSAQSAIRFCQRFDELTASLDQASL